MSQTSQGGTDNNSNSYSIFGANGFFQNFKIGQTQHAAQKSESAGLQSSNTVPTEATSESKNEQKRQQFPDSMKWLCTNC